LRAKKDQLKKGPKGGRRTSQTKLKTKLSARARGDLPPDRKSAAKGKKLEKRMVITKREVKHKKSGWKKREGHWRPVPFDSKRAGGEVGIASSRSQKKSEQGPEAG